MALKSHALQHRGLCCSILVAVHWATYKKQPSPHPMEWQIRVGGGRKPRWRLLRRAEVLDQISGRLVWKCLEFTQWSLSPETPQLSWNSIWDQQQDNNTGYWIRAAKSVLCTALASDVRHIIWEGLRTVVVSDGWSDWEETKQRLDVILATNGPQLFYIIYGFPLHLLWMCLIYTNCLFFLLLIIIIFFKLLASSELSDSTVRKGSFVPRAFVL